MNRSVVAGVILCACSAVCPDDKDVTRSASAGTYVPADLTSDCTGTPVATDPTRTADQLEISDDRTSVTEVYSRDGKVYKVVYDVTGIDKF